MVLFACFRSGTGMLASRNPPGRSNLATCSATPGMLSKKLNESWHRHTSKLVSSKGGLSALARIRRGLEKPAERSLLDAI